MIIMVKITTAEWDAWERVEGNTEFGFLYIKRLINRKHWYQNIEAKYTYVAEEKNTINKWKKTKRSAIMKLIMNSKKWKWKNRNEHKKKDG